MPGDFIEQFLIKNIRALSSSKISEADLCSLKKFDTNNWDPDYSKRLHRMFYHVKYSSAYISEYYFIYKHIFDQRWLLDGNFTSSLSVGCGAMLDLVGFEYARRNSTQFLKSDPYYYGVDITKWGCKFTKIIENCKFYISDISMFDNNRCEKKYDIIFFPKSIKDIGIRKINIFATKLTTDSLCERISVVNSKRGASSDDSAICDSFCKILCERLGYVSKKETLNLSAQGERFEDLLANPFEFDANIATLIRNLGVRCMFCDCEAEKKEECKEIIGKHPIRKTSTAEPDIYYLEKI